MYKLIYRSLLKAAKEADERPAIKGFLTSPGDIWDPTTGRWTKFSAKTAGEGFADAEVEKFCARRYVPGKSLYQFVRNEFRTNLTQVNKVFLLNCLKRINTARELERDYCQGNTSDEKITPTTGAKHRLRPNVVSSQSTEICRGSLLVAHPTQVFRPFRQAVVLMLTQAQGIIINYPIYSADDGMLVLEDVLSTPDPRLAAIAKVPVHMGGPTFEKKYLLHPYNEIYEDETMTQPLFEHDGWFICELTSDLLERLKPLAQQRNFAKDGLKVFLGGLNWEGQRLSQELNRNLWFPIRKTPPIADLYKCCLSHKQQQAASKKQTPDPDAIRIAAVVRADEDDQQAHHMWAALLRSLGGEYADMARVRAMGEEAAEKFMHKLRLYQSSRKNEEATPRVPA